MGYSTPSGTTYDSDKWISVDGKRAEFLKYGRWCNTYRWNIWENPAGGKRCLGIGYDQEKPCLFDTFCSSPTMLMRVTCKRLPKITTKATTKKVLTTISTTIPTSQKDIVPVEPTIIISRKTCYV